MYWSTRRTNDEKRKQYMYNDERLILSFCLSLSSRESSCHAVEVVVQEVRFHLIVMMTIHSFCLDRYGSSRHRGGGGGGGPSNSGGGSGGSSGRRRNSRSRSPRDRTYRDRDRERDRDRYPPRSERPAKRYSRSRSRTRSPSPKAFGNKIVDKRNEPAQRIFDRK